MTGLRERNKSKRRAAILDAAVTLMRDRDFSEVTVEQVAELAEVSTHTVYNLVGPRDELAYALMGRIVMRMADTAPLPEAEPDDPSEPLRAITDHAVDALTAEPLAHRSLMRAVSSLPNWPNDAGEPLVVYGRAAASLDEAGALRPGLSYRVVARHAVLGLYGAAMTWARGQSDARFRDDARLNLALVLAATTEGPTRARAEADIERLASALSGARR